MNLHGLIIDPQDDFCNPQTGALYVQGAEADMVRLASFVRQMGSAITALHVTLDSHHLMDIAHPLWWEDASGNPPPPFTIITRQDVEAGRWQATRPEARARSQAYVAALEAGGRYPLCIWNPHCLMGSVGHTVYAPLFEALCAWEATTRIPVDYIHKGSNIWTEHYSAIQADVPDPDDPTTLPNHALITALREADVVFIAGEAGSHCVANTVRDLVQHLGEDYDLSRLMLLTDTLSPVTGFEALQETFLEEMSERGVRICTTETALAEWAKG